MPNNLTSKNVVLFGAGPMAMEYSKVLKNLGVNFTVVGRSQRGTEKFQKKTGIKPISKGISGWLEKRSETASYGIIAVNFECLADTAIELINAGVRKILLEKPAGLTSKEIKKICDVAERTRTRVFVGYNRRFYASVLTAQKIIKSDGGVESFNFEFTEWSNQIKNKIKNSTVLKNWFWANSSHVIDLAFFLGGKPKKFYSFTAGGNDWHPAATVFSGAGISQTNALFSYQANWEAPGRWGVEVLTRKHRIIFRPIEKLKIQKKNTIDIENVSIEDQLDLKFKPGLYLQTKSFLMDVPDAPFLDINEHYDNILTYYEKIVKPED